jgi:hypothetical protein
LSHTPYSLAHTSDTTTNMAYMFYSISLFVLVLATGMLPITSPVVLVLTCTAAYFTRHRWIHLLPIPEPIYTRLPTSFRDDIEAGLSSSAFDLSGNVEAGDSRQGLDDAGKKEVMRIMKRRGVDFDEARRMFMQDRFKKNGIGADGIPRDPKFVSFS